MKTEVRPEVVAFTGQRVRFPSSRSFDEVATRLRAQVKETSLKQLIDPSKSREEFEEIVRNGIGVSGFMLIAEIDHGKWIQLFGVKRRLIRWIFGNPLIAITMIQLDNTAGLFVPPELLLAENDDGTGCNITYVRPSSLIAIGDDQDLRHAAEALDAKIEAFASSAV
jgi:uncharacterized protein (DUF302 family)